MEIFYLMKILFHKWSLLICLFNTNFHSDVHHIFDLYSHSSTKQILGLSVPFWQKISLTFECTSILSHVCPCLCPCLTHRCESVCRGCVLSACMGLWAGKWRGSYNGKVRSQVRKATLWSFSSAVVILQIITVFHTVIRVTLWWL